MGYITLRISAGRIVELKGQENEAINIISNNASSTRKAIIEIIDDIPTENLAGIISTLSKFGSYHLILEGTPRKVGFYFLFGSQVVIFIDRNFLETKTTIRFLEELHALTSNCREFQINLITPEALESMLYIIRQCKICGKRLQIDPRLGRFLLERLELLQDFDEIKVFESEHHILVIERGLRSITIMRPSDVDSAFMLHHGIKLSERVPSITLELDSLKDSGILEKIVKIAYNFDLGPVEHVTISWNKIQLSTAQFCATISIKEFNEKSLLSALATSIDCLKAGRSVQISV